MIIEKEEFFVKGVTYKIRSAIVKDATELSELRLQIDGETENLDRRKGEGYIDSEGFEELIVSDSALKTNLFLVAEVNNQIVGFSRLEGNSLSRFAHKVEFGVAVLMEYWGYGMGKNLLQQSIAWADKNGIAKITLSVLQNNEKAINLYSKLGFETEGVLKKDKILSDGKYYNTVVMGRFNKNLDT